MPTAEVQKLFGCRRLDVMQLLATGADDPAASWYTCDIPQECAVDPDIEEGEKKSLKGGDRTVETIKQADVLVGTTLKFKNAALSPEATVVIGGGSLVYDVASPTDVIGYSAPTLDESASLLPFKAKLWVARYDAGSLVGYTRFDFYQCTGRVPSFTATQGDFLVPEFTIYAIENGNATGGAKPAFTYRKVDTLGE